MPNEMEELARYIYEAFDPFRVADGWYLYHFDFGPLWRELYPVKG